MNNELLSELKDKLEAMNRSRLLDGREIVIFGANHPGDVIIDWLREHRFKVSAIVDNNTANAGKTMLGVHIFQPDAYLKRFRNDVLVLIASRYYPQMCRQLENWGYREQVHIFQLLQMTAADRFDTSSATFTECADKVRKAIGITEKISENADEVILCPVKANGDIYMLASYLGAFLSNGHHGRCRVAVVGRGCEKIAGLFGLTEVVSITQDECEALENVAALLGASSPIRVIQPYRRHHDILQYFEGYKGFNFADMYKALYGLDEQSEASLISFPDYSREALSVLAKEGLRSQRTVIIAPKANSLPQFSGEFWQKLISAIKKIDWDVCTNLGEPQEEPLPGTKGIFFPFPMMKSVLMAAGAFVSIRNGMCELASSIECTKIVIYPDRAIRHGSLMDLYGLSGLGLANDVHELNYTEQDEREVIESIIHILKMKK